MHPAQCYPRGYPFGPLGQPVHPIARTLYWSRPSLAVLPTFWDDITYPPQRTQSTSPMPPTPLDARDFTDASEAPFMHTSPPHASYSVPCGPDATGGVSAFRPRVFLSPHQDEESAAHSEAEEVYTHRSRQWTLDDVRRREQNLQESWQEELQREIVPTRRVSISDLPGEKPTRKLRKAKSLLTVRKNGRYSRRTIPVTEVFSTEIPEPEYAPDSNKEATTSARVGVFCEQMMDSPYGVEEMLEDETDLSDILDSYDNRPSQDFAFEDNIGVRADSPTRGLEDAEECGKRLRESVSDGSMTPPLSDSGTASVEDDASAHDRLLTPPLGGFAVYGYPERKKAQYVQLLEALVEACRSADRV